MTPASSSLHTKLYAALAGLVALIAALHMATTFTLTKSTPAGKVWFFGAGLAMALQAALNFLNRTHGRQVLALAWTTRVTNVALLAFGAVAGVVTRASTAEYVALVGSLAGLVVLSCWNRALR